MVAPPPAAAPAVQMAAPAPEAAPAPTAPPPAAAAAPIAAPATAEEDAKIEYKGEDSKTITQLEWLEQMISGYERMRASEPETPRPALTSVEQLVTYRVISRMPTPPAGKKFHYDPQTGKVTLVPK